MARHTRLATRLATRSTCTFSSDNSYLPQSQSSRNSSRCGQSWPTIGSSTRLFSANKSVSGNSNSTVPRTAISLLGAVNAGKSVLMNLLTQSDVSLVHSTAGTTADPKICAMELHGCIGPVRLLDTPGINEQGELGRRKRVRAFDTIGECDVALIVADPFEADQVESVADILKQVQRRQEMNRIVQEQVDDMSSNDKESAGEENSSGSNSSRPTPVALLTFNIRHDKAKMIEATGGSVSMLLEDFERNLLEKMKAKEGKGKPDAAVSSLPPILAVDFASTNSASRDRIIGFLERHVDPRRPKAVHLLPDWLAKDTHDINNGGCQSSSPTVFLNIPMDQQTPGMRLLRPQAMIQEALIRNYISTFAYRMDLGMARSDDPVQVQKEKDRFLRAMAPLLKTKNSSVSGDLALLITDSQAIDVVAPWTLDESTGEEIVPITTFSIAMIRYLSGGRLGYFVDGLRVLDQMVQGKVSPRNGEKYKILIAEACNHTRLNMEKECADIGTVCKYCKSV
jgi:small GTP-binding protein